MNKTLLSCLTALTLLAACAPPYPDQEAQQGKTADAVDVAPASEGEINGVKAALRTTLPELNVEHVSATPLPGIYEIQVGMNFGYVTQDGRYLIAGDLTDLQTQRTLTEDRRRVARLALVDRIGSDKMIEFPATSLPAKYTVTVFTDIDCGYCRMLHRQIADYNAEGITVRYAFFPRSGPDTDSFYKAEEVWCAPDRKQALTTAKAGGALPQDKSCDNPISEHLQAAAALGLRGTPAIILPDGEMMPGYQPPKELLKLLEQAAS